MMVYVLTFDTRSSLTGAFDRVLCCEDVASCMIEAEQLRIRFTAPRQAAEPVVEQIYQARGLLFCTRHSVVTRLPSPAA